jgi:hypothetical protein
MPCMCFCGIVLAHCFHRDTLPGVMSRCRASLEAQPRGCSSRNFLDLDLFSFYFGAGWGGPEPPNIHLLA